MEPKPKRSQTATSIHRAAALIFVLTVWFCAVPVSARQDQSDPSAAPPPQTDNPSNQEEGPQGPPPASANAPLPATLTLRAGTVIPVRVTQWLSSDHSRPGDSFSAELDQPLVANGWVIARRGQAVVGRVVVAEKATRGKNESRLGVELASLTLVDGQQLPLKTELVRSATARSRGRDAATVGTTTAIGTIVGAAIGGGEGAAIGAGAGLATGIAAILSTPGRPTVIGPEDLLTFRVDEPLAISTERSQVAFRPVTQSDYNRDADAYANYPPRRYAADGRGYPPPPYYYGGGYCYSGPWACYYPAPLYFGFYGGYGFGPRGVFLGRGGFRR